MLATLVRLEKYVELTWSKPDTFTAVATEKGYTTNKENFDRAQRTAKTLLKNAQQRQSGIMRPLYANHRASKPKKTTTVRSLCPDSIANPEWRWVAIAYEELPRPRPKEKATVNKNKTARAANKGSSRKERRQGKEQ